MAETGEDLKTIMELMGHSDVGMTMRYVHTNTKKKRAAVDQGVPAVRVRRALAALAQQLPMGRSLSGLRIYADGREVAVRDAGAAWQPETGQTVLDFGIDELVRSVERLEREPAPGSEPPDALRARLAFERALRLEDDDPKAAAAAYRRALQLDAELVDAYVNLGRILHEQGEVREAAQFYDRALEHCPDDPVIHFNLALALEDTRGVEPAIRHYEQALDLDPTFADAHFNLAGLCEQVGRGAFAP